MEAEFILALIVAIIVFFLTLIFGEELGGWIKSVGAVILLAPIFCYFFAGTFNMINADPETTQALADSTITKIIDYVTGQLPSVVISELVGAIVGAFGGFVVKVIKG